MILIITHREDYTADFLINKLNKRGINYKRLNCEDILNSDFKVDESLKFTLDEESKFKSVWFRRTKLPKIENVDFDQKLYLHNEYEALLKNLFCIIDAKWLSNPFSIYQAENKLYQLKVAKEIGFTIPKTLVTNSRNELKDFYIQNSNDLIIKPLSQSKLISKDSTEFIFTNTLKKEHLDEIEKYDLTPCIIQQKIDKLMELRVTVVGEEIFVAGINSQISEVSKIDWRKGELKFFKTDLPIEIKMMCIKIVKKLNLRFGAIDLIKDLKGEYIFLEINPNGQWAWIENETGLSISDSIINELL